MAQIDLVVQVFGVWHPLVRPLHVFARVLTNRLNRESEFDSFNRKDRLRESFGADLMNVANGGPFPGAHEHMGFGRFKIFWP